MFTVFPPKWNTDTVYDIGVVGFPGPLCLILVYFCQSTLTLTTLECQNTLETYYMHAQDRIVQLTI